MTRSNRNSGENGTKSSRALLLTLLAVVGVALPLAAQAATVPPITLSQSILGTSADQDDDGLLDSVENELAEILRPFFKFDSAEAARQPFEPVTLFQVRPYDFCAGGPLKLTVRWVFLFEEDGGYGPDSWCDDSHGGDNDIATYFLQSTNGGLTWTVTAINLGGGSMQWTPTNGKSLSLESNTHPVIFMSGHKHHEYFDTSNDHQNSPYSEWGCNDDVNGQGAAFLSDVQSIHGEDPKAGTYNNVGEPGSNHPAPPFVNSVSVFFSGHSAWGTQDFFEVGPNASKWYAYSFAQSGSCQCTSGDRRIDVPCTTSGTGEPGLRTDQCVKGIWDLGVCTALGEPK